MKKILYPLLAIIMVVGVVLISNKKEVLEQSNNSEKKFFTGKELRQQEVERKMERRRKGYAKPDRPSEFVKFYNAIRTKSNEKSPMYPMGYKAEELQKAQQNVQQMRSRTKSEKETLEWKECGPGNVAGRTRGLIIDPDDASCNTWFTGSVGGGIWKTTDAGGSWENLTPNLPNLATTCIAMANSNHQIIYAGTGEGFYNADAIRGDGMFKSTDRGATWKQLSFTKGNYDFSFVNRLVVDPNDENTVVVVTNKGIFKTTDGGASFDEKYRVRATDIIANPNDFNILYVGTSGKGVLKSSDAGETWQQVFAAGKKRYEVAISPSDPQTVYALNADSELFVSFDGGNVWQPTVITSGNQEKYLSGQGWYNNSLAVSLTDPKELFIGGVNVFKVNLGEETGNTKQHFQGQAYNVESFMRFVNFGGKLLNGGLAIVDENSSENVSFEIRFGAGKKQKAHRFTVPIDAATGLHKTKGVPASEYTFADYIEVPFEVWDTDNNRQLMVSFRDQSDDGVFDMEKLDNALATGREYLYIHSIPYENTANADIAKKGGHEYKQIVNIWGVLPDGGKWDAENLPDAKIEFIITKEKSIGVTSKMMAHWAGYNAPYVHADNHNVQIVKLNDDTHRIVVGNDGGVGYSDDNGVSWRNPCNGYVSTQLYGIDKHPTKNKYVIGLQDNGSWVSHLNPHSKSRWREASGGDGFRVVWNAGDPKKVITTVYNNRLYASTDGGERFYSITKEGSFKDLGRGKAPFITRIGYSPAAPDKIYLIGPSGVTRSEDFGTTWELASINSKWGYQGSGEVAVSVKNPDIVWAGCAMGGSSAMHVSTDGGKTFKATSVPVDLGRITSIATHPTEENTAFILFSQFQSTKILRTKDLGKTWEDISGFNLCANKVSTNGFPDVAVYSLLVMPDDPKTIWVGTEIGLFVSNDEGENWHYSDNGLPAVCIWEMKIRGNQIILATHGRGAWTVDRKTIKDEVKAPVIVKTGVTPRGYGIVRYECADIYESLEVKIDGKTIKTLNDTKITKSSTLKLYDYDNSKDHNVQFVAHRGDKVYKSEKVKILKLPVQDYVTEYVTDFTENADNDFENRGLELSESSILGKKVLQSAHPYAENTELISILTKPIKITAVGNTRKANIFYEDIPMVEKGKDGAGFNTEDFRDYVIVEGSLNGLDWVEIAYGYDFKNVEEKAKSAGITSVESAPTKEMLLQHNFDLLETFHRDKLVLLRFRLHSDAKNVGWGWLINNLRIQKERPTAVEKVVVTNTKIYPNPANDYINIDFGGDWNGSVSVSIYTLDGRLVKSQQFEANSERVQYSVSELNIGNYILVLKDKAKKKAYKIQIVR